MVDRDVFVPLQRFLVEATRQRGYCYSVGGDEFIVLLRNSSGVETVAFADRLLRSVQDLEFTCDEASIRLTLSIGLASFPSDAHTLQEVREKANHAENRAKANGRNQVGLRITMTLCSPTSRWSRTAVPVKLSARSAAQRGR